MASETKMGCVNGHFALLATRQFGWSAFAGNGASTVFPSPSCLSDMKSGIMGYFMCSAEIMRWYAAYYGPK
jgi:hypothetical protein